MQQRTHREIKRPRMSARFLADYMAASEVARRSIVQGCKYRSTARVIQHEEARTILGKFLRAGKSDVSELLDAAERLRNRLADSDFDRDLYDHNAEYIARFATVAPGLVLPDATRQAVGQTPALELGGTKVTVDFSVRLLRTTRTNKVRIGAVSLRYAKGKAVDPEAALWEAAFTVGYLNRTEPGDAEPELKLCVVVDAFAGKCHEAPGDSIRRFNNMIAACASIAERWERVPPPKGAVL